MMNVWSIKQYSEGDTMTYNYKMQTISIGYVFFLKYGRCNLFFVYVNKCANKYVNSVNKYVVIQLNM